MMPGWPLRRHTVDVRLLLIFALTFAALWNHGAADVRLNPSEFKAAIIAKVLPYVQWPRETQPPPPEPFVVGIFGNDPVEPILATLVKDLRLDGRDVRVRVIDPELKSAPACQILFVPAAQEERWTELSKSIDATGILTIGDSEFFTKGGGVFTLLVQEQKLEISIRNAKKARLDINSKLLKIAKVVR
jgi:hypothetical protein